MRKLKSSLSETKFKLVPIYLINFIGSLGFSIVVPFLIFLNTDFGGNSFIFGILLAIYSIMQIPGATILGRWSDKVGRKKVLIISQIGTLICWGIYIVALLVPKTILASFESGNMEAFSITLPLLLLFLARGLDGLTGGNISVANAYVADVSTKEQLTTRLGKMSLAYNLGFVAGPAIGGSLGFIMSGTEVEQAMLPILAAFVLSVIAVFLVLNIKKSPKFEKQKEKMLTDVQPNFIPKKVTAFLVETTKPSLKSLWKIKHIPYSVIILFFLSLTISYVSVVFPLHTQTVLGWSVLDLGIFFAIVAVVMVITEGPVLSKLTHRISDAKINILGFIALTASYVLLIETNTLEFLLAGGIAFGIGFSMTTTGLQSLISKIVPHDLQGTLHGSLATIMAMGGVIGMISGGILFEFIEEGVYLMAAIISGILLLMSIRLLKI